MSGQSLGLNVLLRVGKFTLYSGEKNFAFCSTVTSYIYLFFQDRENREVRQHLIKMELRTGIKQAISITLTINV